MRGTCVVVLAAGGSSRFGSPKQLAELGGRTLVERVVDTALALDPNEVLVVQGAVELNLTGVHAVANPDWAAGLSSSIRAGIQALPSDAETCLILVGDQPLVASQHLLRLVSGLNERTTMAASRYPDGRLGVPAAFDRVWFPDLCSLTGDAGARKLLELHRRKLFVVDLDTPADVDTLQDLEKLKEGK